MTTEVKSRCSVARGQPHFIPAHMREVALRLQAAGADERAKPPFEESIADHHFVVRAVSETIADDPDGALPRWLRKRKNVCIEMVRSRGYDVVALIHSQQIVSGHDLVKR